VLDQTGLAQKGGAVTTHIRIARSPADIHAVRIAAGEADLVLGCDMVVVLGHAWQKGLIPLSLDALMRAIELNGVAVESSKRTFNWGRLAAHNLAAVQAAAKPALRIEKPVARTLAEIVSRRVELLTAYQDKAYAERYRALVDKVAKAEKDKAPGRRGLAEAVAKSLYKLMAYKDEYEVARLYSDGDFHRKLRQQFDGDYKVTFHPRAAAVRRPRSGDGRAEEERVRLVDDAGLSHPRFAEAAARRHVRHLRLQRGTAHGAPPDR
jgi:hypothetical protein